MLLTKSGDKKQLRLSCERKLVVLKWTNSNLDGTILKNCLGSNCIDYTWAAVTITGFRNCSE